MDLRCEQPVLFIYISGNSYFYTIDRLHQFCKPNGGKVCKRAKEIGIRKVVGGNQTELILQFLGRIFHTYAFIAFLLAIILVQWVLPVFNHLSNKALSTSVFIRHKTGIGLYCFVLCSLAFWPGFILHLYYPVITRLNVIQPVCIGRKKLSSICKGHW